MTTHPEGNTETMQTPSTIDRDFDVTLVLRLSCESNFAAQDLDNLPTKASAIDQAISRLFETEVPKILAANGFDLAIHGEAEMVAEGQLWGLS